MPLPFHKDCGVVHSKRNIKQAVSLKSHTVSYIAAQIFSHALLGTGTPIWTFDPAIKFNLAYAREVRR
jgi:hypothetical protein